MADEDDSGTDIGKGKCIHETARAILVRLETGEEQWIPKSCVHDNSEVWEDGGEGKVVVKTRWAEKEGLG
jgi:hypothetical protein